jgi:hypothetical protein
MRRRLVWAVLGLGLPAACADTRKQLVMERMAEEYNCHQGDMTVTEFTANGYRVTGCGYTANYDCTYGTTVSTTCVKEADSSPVPALPGVSPSGEDGGTK